MSIILDYGCGNSGCYWTEDYDTPTEQNFGSKDRGNTFILNCSLLILLINGFIYCCINISSEKNIKRDNFLKCVYFRYIRQGRALYMPAGAFYFP